MKNIISLRKAKTNAIPQYAEVVVSIDGAVQESASLSEIFNGRIAH